MEPDLDLPPIIDWIGNYPVEHGERGREFDTEHPQACLCGRYSYYLMCPGPGIEQSEADRANDAEWPMKPSVSIEEIDEQRRLGWPDFHPEDYCHRCGGRNRSWFVASDRFNAAFGPPSEHPYQGIVCTGCFVEAHEAATGLRTTWELVPAEHFHPIEERM